MIKVIDFIFHIDKYLEILISNYGNFVYVFLFLIIFMETGFVFTPFLPGDSLLFVCGTFASTGFFNIYFLFLLLSIAAILGDTINYWIGNYFGEKIFSKFINPEHLEKTKLFFKNHGKKTIVLARFVPIIRTFAPFVAGVGKMKYSVFLFYNIVGGITWVGAFLLAGYFFGNINYVKENLSWIILLIVVASFIPLIIDWLRRRHYKNHDSFVIKCKK